MVGFGSAYGGSSRAEPVTATARVSFPRAPTVALVRSFRERELPSDKDSAAHPPLKTAALPKVPGQSTAATVVLLLLPLLLLAHGHWYRSSSRRRRPVRVTLSFAVTAAYAQNLPFAAAVSVPSGSSPVAVISRVVRCFRNGASGSAAVTTRAGLLHGTR